ncbi:ester cyclase [Pseudonocardia sp. CA-107938]|uniref:ester cyclase n=1 Tax=Pseudonocardia sp. CA-107938 TaxID=3240021 RepID=UPI003D89E8FE
MTPDEIRARARRITEELFNQGDLAVVDELIDPGYTQYLAVEGRTTGADELTAFVTAMRHAFPDLRAHTEQQIVEGDTLVQRLTLSGTHDGAEFGGLPAATGAQLQVDLVDIYRIGPSGRFVQRWTLWDEHAVRTQLGIA